MHQKLTKKFFFSDYFVSKFQKFQQKKIYILKKYWKKQVAMTDHPSFGLYIPMSLVRNTIRNNKVS